LNKRKMPPLAGGRRLVCPLTSYSRAHGVQDLAGFVDNLKIEKFRLAGLSTVEFSVVK